MRATHPQIAASFAIALSALIPATGNGCCALGRAGQPVVNADQTVLLVWDPKTKTEHFIRKASFKADGADFGFLVPTPSKPELSESGNDAFPYLANITRPLPKSGGGGFGCGCSKKERMLAQKSVTVIERKEVAGFDAAVLSANSATALTGWLKTNGYHFSPEVEAWAAPYIRDGWMMTALRVIKPTGEKEDPDVSASALRITFSTERPIFPYREPDSREAAKKVGASSRLLRLYFISDARYEGALGGTNSWSGKAVWSNAITDADKAKLIGHLKLPESSGPAKWWLTEFEDRWPYGIAPGDLYFAPSKKQEPLARSLYASSSAGVDAALPFCAAAGLIVFLRGYRTSRHGLASSNLR
jgi:hypothetical protein